MIVLVTFGLILLILLISWITLGICIDVKDYKYIYVYYGRYYRNFIRFKKWK